MAKEGSTCAIIIQPPTDDDIHDFQHIFLSDEFDWHLSKNLFEIS